MPRKKGETPIEIPGDWHGADKRLWKLAQSTGFQTLPRLLSFVRYEVSHCKTPAQLYRAISCFHECSRKKRHD